MAIPAAQEPTEAALRWRWRAASFDSLITAVLYGIATVLRHSSIETTTIYAKVDLKLLGEVAQPWPEVLR